MGRWACQAWLRVVTSIEASVGPKRLYSGMGQPAEAVSFRRWEKRSASPVQEIWRREGRSPGRTKSRKRERTDGTKWATVTRPRAMTEARVPKSRWAPSGTTTEVQPRQRGTQSSAIEQSNVAGVLCTKTSEAVNWSTSQPHTKRCQTPAVGTTQPLGLPVEPEVYMMYMTSGAGQGATLPALLRTSICIAACWMKVACSTDAHQMFVMAQVALTEMIAPTQSAPRSGCDAPSSMTTALTRASFRMSVVRSIGHVGCEGGEGTGSNE